MTENTPSGLLSIERVVAFVLGPAITALSGWLSLSLAKKWGIHIGGPEITGIFSAGAVTAAALVYKWLHGRQVEMHATAAIAAAEAKLGGVPGASDFIHTTLADLEGLAQHAASHAVEGITGTAVGEGPPGVADAAEGDPAPAGLAADAEAANGQ